MIDGEYASISVVVNLYMLETCLRAYIGHRHGPKDVLTGGGWQLSRRLSRFCIPSKYQLISFTPFYGYVSGIHTASIPAVDIDASGDLDCDDMQSSSTMAFP